MRRMGLAALMLGVLALGMALGGGAAWLAMRSPVGAVAHRSIAVPERSGAAPDALHERNLEAAALMHAGRLRDAQDMFLEVLTLASGRDAQDATRGLVAVRRRIAADDAGLLRREAAGYRSAAARGTETKEHYSPASMVILAAVSLEAARESEAESEARGAGPPRRASLHAAHRLEPRSAAPAPRRAAERSAHAAVPPGRPPARSVAPPPVVSRTPLVARSAPPRVAEPGAGAGLPQPPGAPAVVEGVVTATTSDAALLASPHGMRPLVITEHTTVSGVRQRFAAVTRFDSLKAWGRVTGMGTFVADRVDVVRVPSARARGRISAIGPDFLVLNGAVLVRLDPTTVILLGGRPTGTDQLTLGQGVEVAGRWTGAALIPGHAALGVVPSLTAEGIELGGP